MSNRELRAVAEAINDAAGDFPYSTRYGNKLAKAAISASNSQYVKGLVEALKNINIGIDDRTDKVPLTLAAKLSLVKRLSYDALQNLPEDLR